MNTAQNRINVFLGHEGGRTLRSVALAMVVGGALAELAITLGSGEFRAGAGLQLGMLGVIVAVMLERAHQERAFGVLIWGCTLIPLLNATRFGGLNTLALAMLPITTMMAGLLMSRRQAFVVVSTVIAGLVGLYLQNLFTQVPETAYPNEARIIVYIGIVGVALTLAMRSASAFSEAYQRAVGLTQDLERQLRRVSESEAALRELNDTLEAKVVARTTELQHTIAQLKHTQSELVQLGTLASLGSLVAGVSHELNTPIGNALTTATTLESKVISTQELVASGTIKRSTLETFFSQSHEMTGLLIRSITRAAGLISQFKQVAVDQTSEQRREFALPDLIDSVVSTVRPGIKQLPWELKAVAICPTRCDSFPGPLGQVLTNLIQNAVMHAFAGRDHGTMVVSATLAGSTVTISVSDDGIGMDERTAARIFEPFFTTRLGRGGSGLGLSVCHRIVTSVLGGKLSVVTAPDQGARFVLELPVVAPGRL